MQSSAYLTAGKRLNIQKSFQVDAFLIATVRYPYSIKYDKLMTKFVGFFF